MMMFLTIISIALLVIVLVFLFAPRPRLDPEVPATSVPPELSPADLATWLASHEAAHDAVIEGADATIAWADGPAVQDLCLLYVHGFSATRQETAPLTERVADRLGANVVYTRLAGHGLERNAMEAAAEHWLQSMVDSWEIASRIGRKVVVIAVSTGAPLSIWLNEHVAERDQVHSFVFLAPNFKIRNPFGFLLTWPWAPQWLPMLVGKEHSWEPENELSARYWSSRYPTHAVIEMQKVVDWAKQQKLAGGNVPLATLYMEGDPTIDHDAAVNFHEAWEADTKSLHQVTIDAHNPQHVFVGDITAPHRIDWCVDTCVEFIRRVE
jgi:esterase/lipase